MNVSSLLAAVSLLLLFAVPIEASDPPPTGSAAPGQTKGLEEALRRLHAPLAGGEPLSPTASLKKFQVAEGLAVELIAAEPTVRQPVHLSFDPKGRLWVVNYEQYPFPAGLRIVEYDRYIRAKFDKVPPPPPNHFPGRDRITIHEDTDGDGTFDRVKTFVEGLNIATSVLVGDGGVWVSNPPYLLFYPDRNGDDIPDGDPEVHLSGFGLEDTHAVMNSLTWGPDGWIYGAQGSTCTAKVRVEMTKQTQTTDFLGQAIWRYHPPTHRFEIVAEGGGNTFGVVFDDQGRLFSGTNYSNYRGVHYVQGGYYIKGWGKHGPLTNPFAFGYFDHMPHTGNGDRLTHTFIVYGGDSLPRHYHGKIIGPSPLQHRLHVSRLEPLGSTFRTVEEPFLLSSSDGWFRPVDVKAGPDGALYVADLYENRISHVDPRDNWHRSSGRVYRIKSAGAAPLPRFNLFEKSSEQLVELLGHPNRWFRENARRVLADRHDASVVPTLRRWLREEKGQRALEALWVLNLLDPHFEENWLVASQHENPAVRLWVVRLLADRQALPRSDAVLDRVARETNREVLSQWASTAKRVPAPLGLRVAMALFSRDELADDPYIPLLLWWAVEAHAGNSSGRELILDLLQDQAIWHAKMAPSYLIERVAQRWAMAGSASDLTACTKLLLRAPDGQSRDRVLFGIEKGLSGRAAGQLPAEFRSAIAQALAGDRVQRHLLLGIRVGHPGAVETALTILRDEKAPPDQRLDLIRLLTEVPQPAATSELRELLRQSKSVPLRLAALTALQRQAQPEVGQEILHLACTDWAGHEDLVAAACMTLAGRPAWALILVQAVDAGTMKAQQVPLEAVRLIKRYDRPELARLVEKHWGRIRPSTPAEKQEEMLRLANILKSQTGSESAGKIVFSNSCAKCHKLFGEGGTVGPDLTGYERTNIRFWLENIIDPSAMIRDEYQTIVIDTQDGRTLTGIVAAQDQATLTLRLNDGQTVRLPRKEIEEMRASPTSLMPDDLLKNLTDQQIRDLFAYLMKKS
jgi:putative heme-binding domain-containing protein